MNTLKFAVSFIFCLMLPAGVVADTNDNQTPQPAKVVKPEVAKPAKSAKPASPEKKAAVSAEAKKKKPEGLIIGKNLNVGMSVEDAIKLLGTPRSIKVKRGTESTLDSLSIEYANHGVVIHFLNGNKEIEGLELMPQFKGRFAEGVKMGEKVVSMIDKYGVPESMNDSLAKYPEKGMYFSLKSNVLVAAHVFSKNSKLLSHKLYKKR